ncbi:MAG: hypothetical protein HY011_10910 [Acidobacteria bacterium]|nr:hypothetical protein [Acidobacteriota bacterium]
MNSNETTSAFYQTQNYNPTDPAGAALPPSLSGIEVLALTIAAPAPTAHLALAEGALATASSVTAESEGAWTLAAGGALPLNLQLTYQHGVTLIVELCGTDVANAPEITLGIEVNAAVLELAGLSGKQSFYKRSWYLTPDLMHSGDNRLVIKLPADAPAPIRLKSVAVMRFNLQRQEQKYWCWASVASGIHSFFEPAVVLSQSQIVEACLGSPENKTLELAQALKKLGTLVCSHEAVPGLGEIRKQLSNGVPVPVRIGWTTEQDGRRVLNKRGHFIVITGVLQSDARGDDFTLVRVADPAHDMASYMPYGILKNGYNRNQGVLTHFYILKKQDSANTANTANAANTGGQS